MTIRPAAQQPNITSHNDQASRVLLRGGTVIVLFSTPSGRTPVWLVADTATLRPVGISLKMGPDSAAKQGLQLGEHHLPRLAAQVGGSGRVRALAHHEPGPTVVVVVELQP